ncbi:MAG TPA: 4Fe-4S binding protein [Pyrinomonadaceae bacterium]|nr:4Fe-4S binding protein [Pyrinomonadaceae bacterium]
MKQGCSTKKRSSKRSISLPILDAKLSPKDEEIAKSSTSKWRAIALISLQLLMVAHIIQWQMMGETVSPIEPSEAMHTLQTGAVNAGFIFFSLAIIATLIFGRFVCGWGCHVLALQDGCAWLLKKLGLRPRPFRSRLLIYIPLAVALYMFVWPAVNRWIVKHANEPLMPHFTNHVIVTDLWATFPPVWIAIPFLFICGFVTVYFLGSKGFCTYACPYGGFFGVADKIAPGRIRVTDACNSCGHCTATCTSNVIVHAEVKQYGMVVDPGCMKCMDCVSVCPNDALYFGFGRPAVLVRTGSDSDRVSKSYSITWPEEIAGVIAFALSFFAVWDVYQIVPMLMALGIATVSTYLFLRLFQMYRSRDLSFYRWNLKASGKISSYGLLFTVFAIFWLGFNAHSGVVRYFEAVGARAFESVRLPDELALAQADPRSWLSPADRAAIERGRDSFRNADRIAVLTNVPAISKQAWLEYLSGDANEAVDILKEAAETQEGQAGALSLYYRGAILNRLGRPSEALTELETVAAEFPSMSAALEEKGESLWRLGRREEAIETWRLLADKSPNIVLSNYFLAGAYAAAGDQAASSRYEAISVKNVPVDAYFLWMVGQRLQNIGMAELAEKNFARAIVLDPKLKARRLLDVPVNR